MSSTLRTNLIRLAATFPSESSERKVLLNVLAQDKVAATDLEVAQWVLDSYPETGDANFVVRGMPVVGPSVAAEFLEGLRSYFASKPFVSVIMRAFQNMDPEGGDVITVENQEKAFHLFKDNAREFLHDMYRTHHNGRVLFNQGSGRMTYQVVEAWVKKHRS